ncbi:MAG: hypothetical protein H2060_10190 [Azoarcus sp.]|nr:hypothetical protein [Azoarcus sp.]
MRIADPLQNALGRGFGIEIDAVAIQPDAVVFVVRDRDPFTVVADRDPIGNTQSGMQQYATAADRIGCAGVKQMARDAVDVVVAHQGFIEIGADAGDTDRPRGHHLIRSLRTQRLQHLDFAHPSSTDPGRGLDDQHVALAVGHHQGPLVDPEHPVRATKSRATHFHRTHQFQPRHIAVTNGHVDHQQGIARERSQRDAPPVGRPMYVLGAADAGQGRMHGWRRVQLHKEG